MAVDPLTDDSRWTVVGDCAGLLDYRLRGGRMIHRDAEIGETYIEISCSVRGVDPLWRTAISRDEAMREARRLGVIGADIPIVRPGENPFVGNSSPSWWQRQTREQQRFLIVCAAVAAIWLISAVVYIGFSG